VTRSVVLPLAEIELQVSRSSGPGGQHAQKSETRVVAVFDVEASTALSEVQKRRVISRAAPVLRAVAQDERSQTRNRELAVERLVATLREALRVERKRVPTRPTTASRERRLEKKKRRSKTKRLSRQVTGIASGFFVPLFFVALGAKLDLRAVFQHARTLELAVLLVRDAKTRTLLIADGYHRACASYWADEDTEIPCRLV